MAQTGEQISCMSMTFFLEYLTRPFILYIPQQWKKSKKINTESLLLNEKKTQTKIFKSAIYY